MLLASLQQWCRTAWSQRSLLHDGSYWHGKHPPILPTRVVQRDQAAESCLHPIHGRQQVVHALRCPRGLHPTCSRLASSSGSGSTTWSAMGVFFVCVDSISSDC